jgi:hypothetical protein
MEEIERSFVASREHRMQRILSRDSDESESGSVGGDLVNKIQSMKQRIAELDRRVLDGCEGCAVAEEVDASLRHQEELLGDIYDAASLTT